MSSSENEESLSESEDSLADDDIDEELLESRINELRDKLCDNQFDYDSHLQLIGVIRKSGDLKKLRDARENMAKCFPLTPVLWLQWIRDESGLATSDEEKSYVFELFERAVGDYVSMDVWLEYVQYSICLLGREDGIKRIRDIFERAIDTVGLNVSSGSLIWEAYREFENSVIAMTNEDEIPTQLDRIYTLFKRQFSVPLLHMEAKFDEFQEWINEAENMGKCYTIDEVKFVFDKALVELQKLKAYEDALVAAGKENYDDYLKYIEFEEVNGTPARVQCIYERAILDHCLVADLWLKYTCFLDLKVKISSISKQVYERSLRNCPWVAELWINYIKSVERFNEQQENITEIFERALQSGFSSGSDFKNLWMCYLDYLRRSTDFTNEQEVNKLRKCFSASSDHLGNFEDSDPNFDVLRYLAKIEAKFCKNLENARKIWKESLLNHRSISGKAEMWIEYANLERLFGEEPQYRKILLKALNSVNDWPESVGELLIKYEREEGTSINDLDEVCAKYKKAIEKITSKRKVTEEKERNNLNSKITGKQNEKREIKGKRKNESVQEASSSLKDQRHKDSSHPSKKPKIEERDEMIKQVIPSPPKYLKPSDDNELKRLHTVYVSNLNFHTTEEKLREVFSQFGKITDVRLVKNYKGLSKGFVYIEFETIEAVKEALKNDRMPIDGRPAFISEMDKRVSFKYKVGLEKHKLFVDNLSSNTTKEDLKRVFEKYGELSDVRIVTYRNGHSKGKAYVEYKDELGSQNGLKANGMLLNDKHIVVALSNPPQKSDKGTIPKVLGGASFSSHSSERAKARIGVPLIPTAVRKHILPQSANGASVGSQLPAQSMPMSNEDFRKNLFNK